MDKSVEGSQEVDDEGSILSNGLEGEIKRSIEKNTGLSSKKRPYLQS